MKFIVTDCCRFAGKGKIAVSHIRCCGGLVRSCSKLENAEATKMHKHHQLDQQADNRRVGVRGMPLPRDKMSRLKQDCAALIPLADRLEALAGNVHSRGRADQAHHLLNCLRSDVTGHLDAEAAVLGEIRKVEDTVFAATIHRAQAEHTATRQLIAPVIRGLRSIQRDRLPRRLVEFVIETIVFCEFLRLHTRFKLETLYPLLARLKPHEAEESEDRGTEINPRQSLETAEANGNASTLKTTANKAETSWNEHEQSIRRNGRMAPPPSPEIEKMLINIYTPPRRSKKQD